MKELRQAQAQARNENLARSSGQASSGQASSGQASSGQVSSGHVSSGQVSLGQSSSGQTSSGQTRGENQSLAQNLAHAKVEKWQIWKGSAEEET